LAEQSFSEIKKPGIAGLFYLHQLLSCDSLRIINQQIPERCGTSATKGHLHPNAQDAKNAVGFGTLFPGEA
jgi:hypothetical protein